MAARCPPRPDPASVHLSAPWVRAQWPASWGQRGRLWDRLSCRCPPRKPGPERPRALGTPAGGWPEHRGLAAREGHRAPARPPAQHPRRPAVAWELGAELEFNSSGRSQIAFGRHIHGAWDRPRTASCQARGGQGWAWGAGQEPTLFPDTGPMLGPLRNGARVRRTRCAWPGQLRSQPLLWSLAAPHPQHTHSLLEGKCPEP